MTKPTWIFVAGTYRSGSTTHYRMTRDIVEWTENGTGIGYHTEAKLKEFDAEEEHRYIVCKVFEFLPEGFRGETSHGEIIARQDRMKAIVSVRDPRDIIVSMRKRADDRGGDNRFDFDREATENFPVWLGQVEKWVDLGDSITLVSHFEEFTVNLLAEVRRIAGHLGIDLPDKIAKSIAREYTVKSLLKAEQDHKQAEPQVRQDPWLPSVPAIVFGTSGHWQTWLTPREAKMVYEANRGFFERFGYGE